MVLPTVHSGLDFLKIRGVPSLEFFQKIFLGVDTENTNTRNIDFLGIYFIVSFHKIPHGIAADFRTDTGENLFSVEKISENAKKFQKLDKNKIYFNINFYGQLFSFDRINPNFSAQNFCFGIEENLIETKVIRADICFDFLGKTPAEIAKMANPQRRVRSVFIGKDGKPETYYIGDTTRNPRVFCRIYDKKKDILAKNKHRFYADYLAQNQPITRFEFECRSTALTEYQATFHRLFDSLFIDSFAEKISLSPYLRLSIDFSKKTVARISPPKNKNPMVEYYSPRFLSLARNLRDLGISPEKLLSELTHRA